MWILQRWVTQNQCPSNHELIIATEYIWVQFYVIIVIKAWEIACLRQGINLRFQMFFLKSWIICCLEYFKIYHLSFILWLLLSQFAFLIFQTSLGHCQNCKTDIKYSLISKVTFSGITYSMDIEFD